MTRIDHTMCDHPRTPAGRKACREGKKFAPVCDFPTEAALEQIAREEMERYGLLAKGWKFKWNSAKLILGKCSYKYRTIYLSRPLAGVNTIGTMKETILHEIAHALVGPGANHGPTWMAKAVELGARPVACNQDALLVTPPWKLECPKCMASSPRYRKPNMSRRYRCRYCSVEVRLVDGRTGQVI